MAAKSDEVDKEEVNRISKKVLFVRNLSYVTKDEDFEKAFSDIGPLRRSYLIKSRDGSNKCKGIGYVTFAFEEDAQKAKDTVKTLDGRQLKITFSDKKPRQKRQKRGQSKPLGSDDDENNNVGQKEIEQGKNDCADYEEEGNSKSPSKLNSPEKKARKPKSQRSQPQNDAGRTVHILGLPSTISIKQIYKRCRKFGNIEKTVFPLEGRDESVAALVYKTPTEARTAVKKLDKKVMKGKEVAAVLKSKEQHQPSKKSLKKSRLIVRNLSFKCTEAILMEFFSQYGKVTEINIPFSIKGKRKRKQGFAFVQFLDVFSAAKAREELNLKEILGRPIAIDWAIAKDQYEKAEKLSQENSELKDDFVESHDSDGEDNEEDKDDEKDFDHDDDDGEDDEDEDSHNKGEDDQESDDDDDNEELQESKKHPSDVKEGLTVFISNLNYDTTEKSLYRLCKRYGDIAYCKIVTDPLTEHSKGTAFIKFKSVESVEKCLADANVEGDESDGLFLDGHKLRVNIAVTRGKAEQLKMQNKESKKEPRDKRNLYLAREGVITQGSEAAKDLSKSDLQKRQKAEAEKKAKLRNPNCFVSTTRLCVRNLPLTTTEKELTKVFSTAGAISDKKPALVKKTLILRSKERVDGTGKGRSLGFGFVEFSNHKEALTALRATNNNPEIFGPNRRLIVEFSIENSLALKARQQRMARSRTKEKRSEEEGLVVKTNKQKRMEKAARRREKRQARKLNKRGVEGTENKNASKGISNKDVGQKKGKYPAKNLISNESTFKKSKNQFLTKQQKKPFNKRDRKPSNSLGKNINLEINKPDIKNFTNPRSVKRRATDTKEENEFNAIVQKYKSKLFGDLGSNAKRTRWFE